MDSDYPCSWVTYVCIIPFFMCSIPFSTLLFSFLQIPRKFHSYLKVSFGLNAGFSIFCSRRLQPLVEYVLILGKTLEKKHGSGLSESSTSGLARRLKKMLVELNEYDKARAISRTFQLKEAI